MITIDDGEEGELVVISKGQSVHMVDKGLVSTVRENEAVIPGYILALKIHFLNSPYEFCDLEDSWIRGTLTLHGFIFEQPEERGFWYDGVVTAWRSTSSRKVLEVTIHGPDQSR